MSTKNKYYMLSSCCGQSQETLISLLVQIPLSTSEIPNHFFTSSLKNIPLSRETPYAGHYREFILPQAGTRQPKQFYCYYRFTPSPPPSPTPQISSTYSHLNNLIMHSSSLWSGYKYLGYNISSFSKVMTSSNIRSR